MASRALSSVNGSSLNLHFFKHSITSILIQEFNYNSINQVPKVDKVVVGYGPGEVVQNPKGIALAMSDLAILTGQQPGKMGAVKPLAMGRPKEKEMPLELCVTLRGKMMYSFLERVINLGLPRILDFQGAYPNSFDGKGNYRLAFREQSVFEEFRDHILGKPRPLHVQISTTARTDQEAERLLALMGMPFGDGEGGRAETIKRRRLENLIAKAKIKSPK